MSEKYAFIDAGYATVAADTAAAPTVTRMCEWLQISKSGFYEWRSRPESATAKRREMLKTKIRALFKGRILPVVATVAFSEVRCEEAGSSGAVW